MDAKQMSDNSKRTVCRLAFLLLCALPSLFVAYKIFHPVTTQQWQQAIKADLGLVTHIQQVQTPLPFLTVFEDVRLEDPELGQLVNIEELVLQTGPTNQITIQKPVRIHGSSLLTIADSLRESLLRTHSASKPWKIRIENATIVHPNNGFAEEVVTTPVEISINPYPTITITDVELKLANDPSATPIRFSMRRNRDSEGARETIELRTGQTFLPCWLVHDLLPDTQSLGPACAFAGFAKLESGEKGWNGILDGNFSRLDLASLTQPYGRGFEGLCNLLVQDCVIEESQFKSLTADLICETGSMDQATANSAKQFLGIQVVGDLPTSNIEFKHLMVRVELDGNGRFTLSGLYDSPKVLALAEKSGIPLLQTDSVYSHAIDAIPTFLAGEYDSPHAMNVKVDVLSHFHRPPVRVAEEGNTRLH